MRICLFLIALWASSAHAHAPPPETPTGTIPWSFEPWVIVCLALSLGLYVTGVVRLWGKAGAERGISGMQLTAFLAGWLSLVGALVSPLDALGNLLFSAHMVQHETLMVLAAPLLVLGRPLAVWTWGLPPGWRRGAGRVVRWTPLAAAWNLLTHAPVAWAVHGVVLWAWHIPALFEAALASNAIHTLQHTSFFVSALLFWWAPLGAASRASRGASMFYLFTTMVHTGALGALLTFAPTLWYPSYGASTAALGLNPLEDQQLGGLVMWVPAGLAYLFVGLVVTARALQGPRHMARS
jgi:putative membrane protein